MYKTKLGFISIVLLTINAIIGTGIFLSPGSVVMTAGTKAPIIYFVAALLAITLAVTFASAAKYVTKSGAAYAYAEAAFGENVGFYVGVTRFIAASIAWGVLATGVVKTFMSIYGIDSTDLKLVTLGFLILMGILLVINLLGINFFKLINNISTAGKVAALLTAIIAGGIIVVTTGQNHFYDVTSLTTASGEPLIPEMNVTVFITATLAAFYAFTGFESVASGSEDMEKPEKNLPRALPIGILIVAAINIGIVVIAMMLNSEALVETKEVVVLAAVFKSDIIRNIILYGSLVSMLGINVAASFNTPRILEALAQNKQVPSLFSRRTKSECPIWAVLLTIVVAIIIPVSFGYNMTNIMILSSVSRFIQFLVVPVAVIFFFYGKQKGEVIQTAPKSVVTDVAIPVIAFLFSLFLMVKFNWQGQFSITNDMGEKVLNIGAVSAIAVGYVILPIVLYLWKSRGKRNS
jgi:amino acid transporter